ncbi:transposase [Streptococcus sp. A22]|uniref:transposase n=1 Tax=Streptococcus sp. A22 TaxID=3373126 RepID=UPI00374D0821
MEELLAIIKQQATTIEVMSNELALLREQVAYLTQKLYGKSSEKLPQMSGQLSLFEEDGLSEEESDLPS